MHEQHPQHVHHHPVPGQGQYAEPGYTQHLHRLFKLLALPDPYGRKAQKECVGHALGDVEGEGYGGVEEGEIAELKVDERHPGQERAEPQAQLVLFHVPGVSVALAHEKRHGRAGKAPDKVHYLAKKGVYRIHNSPGDMVDEHCYDRDVLYLVSVEPGAGGGI